MEPTANAVSGCQPKPSNEELSSIETQSTQLGYDTLIKPEPRSPSLYKEPANDLIDSIGQETKEGIMEEKDSAILPNPTVNEVDKAENLRDDAAYDASFEEISVS
jgi:hypothetical protein